MGRLNLGPCASLALYHSAIYPHLQTDTEIQHFLKIPVENVRIWILGFGGGGAKMSSLLDLGEVLACIEPWFFGGDWGPAKSLIYCLQVKSKDFLKWIDARYTQTHTHMKYIWKLSIKKEWNWYIYTWMNLEDILLSEVKSDLKGQTLYNSTGMRSLKQKNSQRHKVVYLFPRGSGECT